MKVITEQILRSELKNCEVTEYIVPDGKILSPAGREYLQGLQIKICKKDKFTKNTINKNVDSRPIQTMSANAKNAKFVDFVTGAFYEEKPEHMTHLYSNVLVAKNHERISFRGKLDMFEAEIIFAQTELYDRGVSAKLLDDLDDIMRVISQIMRSDVMNLPYENATIIGLTHEQIHERSHNPKKFYNIEKLLMPDYRHGREYAIINRLRASVRSVEIYAVDAFMENGKCTRSDIVLELNRLSSCLHLIGCMYLSGEYA